VADDMLYFRFKGKHVLSKVKKRKAGDWFAAKKLQVGEEKRVV
jgi:hypothetical protein